MNSSYVYIYDDFVLDRNFEREVASLETELSTYGMSGQIGKLTLFRGAHDLVRGLVKDDVTTVVIVGNDSTLDKTMWFLPDLDVTIGYIPITQPSAVADLLGIPCGVKACEILAARYVETIDMGKMNDRYFLTEVSMSQTLAGIEIEGEYTVSSQHGGSLSIRNLGGLNNKKMDFSNAQDGLLEAVITPQAVKEKRFSWKRKTEYDPTRIAFKDGKIISKDPVEAFVDNHVVNGFEFSVSVVPKALKMITGRVRRRSIDTPLQKAKMNGTLRSSRVSLPRGQGGKTKHAQVAELVDAPA